MFAALIIVFREVVEAGLVVGVVLAVTQTVPGRLRYVFGGVAAGITGAGIVALFTGLIAEALAGTGQEVLNASVLGIAVVMLTWHNVWMARHGREMTQELSDFGQQVSSGSKSLLALVSKSMIALAGLVEMQGHEQSGGHGVDQGEVESGRHRAAERGPLEQSGRITSFWREDKTMDDAAR